MRFGGFAHTLRALRSLLHLVWLLGKRTRADLLLADLKGRFRFNLPVN